jgi:hypothetical protein
MRQYSIYLDAATENRVKEAARCAGAWRDFPSLSALRKQESAPDVRRGKL